MITKKAEITKEEFLQRMERSVQHAKRQPSWMVGLPENRRQTSENEVKGRVETVHALSASGKA
jgi:tRNA A37 N6-isopentenylltransferase MiaA